MHSHGLMQDPAKDIKLFINSPGGSVTAGMGIYDAMMMCNADVQVNAGTRVCGVGASSRAGWRAGAALGRASRRWAGSQAGEAGGATAAGLLLHGRRDPGAGTSARAQTAPGPCSSGAQPAWVPSRCTPPLPPGRPQTYCFGLAASMGAFLLGAGGRGSGGEGGGLPGVGPGLQTALFVACARLSGLDTLLDCPSVPWPACPFVRER